MQAQGNLVGLAHGPRRWGVGGQEPRGTNENIAGRFRVLPQGLLLEPGVDDLEPVETGILPQHGAAKGGQQCLGVPSARLVSRHQLSYFIHLPLYVHTLQYLVQNCPAIHRFCCVSRKPINTNLCIFWEGMQECQELCLISS